MLNTVNERVITITKPPEVIKPFHVVETIFSFSRRNFGTKSCYDIYVNKLLIGPK